MLPKVLQYKDQFENTGEPRVRMLDPFRGKAGFYKQACAEVNDYLAAVRPKMGKRYVLVLAMGASELYGPNRNGDGFSEDPVRVRNNWAVSPGETLRDHFKTFETHANVFRHHINKDPAKGFGTVAKAFYNEGMHRVELLLELDVEKGSDIISKLDRGEFPGVSMGCRIKYDVCSICGNQAPTLAQYCEHVNGRNPEFGMNQLMPDGRKCFVFNPSPTLFDLSFVFKPADRIGYTMMRKVAGAQPYVVKSSASAGEDVYRLSQKKSTLQKLSTIDKIIQGDVVDPASMGMGPGELRATKSLVSNVLPSVMRDSPQLPDKILEGMSRLSIPSMLSSTNACGIIPTTPELHIIISKKQGITASPEIGKRLGMLQGVIAEVLSEMPQVLDHMEEGLLKFSSEYVDGYTVNALRPYTEKRALWEDRLARKYIPESVGGVIGDTTGAYDTNNTYYNSVQQPLHFRSPETGRVYQTTRDAGEKADLANKKKLLIEGAGVAGLLGLGVKSLTASPKWRWLGGAALGGAGILGNKVVSGQKVPKVMTREGVGVPANTEFVEKRSGAASEVVAPLAGGALLSVLLAQDLGGVNGHAPGGVAESLQRTAREQPGLMTIAGAAAIGGTMGGAKYIKSALKNKLAGLAKSASYDTTVPPAASFEDLVYKIGEFVVDGY